MNELNVASLQASKKLVEAGIVLETDAVWARDEIGWYLRSSFENTEREVLKSYPAPSMAEVWRELPEGTECIKQATETKCITMSKDNIKVFFSKNPADALIELRIWLEKEKKK